MSVYFKNRYTCSLPGVGITPIKSFYYRADMVPKLKWKIFEVVSSGTKDRSFSWWSGPTDISHWSHALIHIFYYMAPYITETLQVTLPTPATVNRVWDETTEQWVYGETDTIKVTKNIANVQTFGVNPGPITGQGFTHYPKAIDDCLLESIRSDMGSKSFTSTWRSTGGRVWHMPEPGDSLVAWGNLRGDQSWWPTEPGLIMDGSYIRNSPDTWAVRCSPRSIVFPGQYVKFGAVEGRIASVTESANVSAATMEVSGYHSYVGWRETPSRFINRNIGYGDTRTFYGICKLVRYETFKESGEEWSGEWERYVAYEKGPNIGDPAAFIAQKWTTAMMSLTA